MPYTSGGLKLYIQKQFLVAKHCSVDQVQA